MNKLKLSVIIPCYNEQDVILATHKEITNVCLNIDKLSFQLIYVNDGSSDETLNILKLIQSNDREFVKIVNLSRNFGHQVAVTAGIDNSDGDAVVIIDADLQDPPEVIPMMVEKWREGSKVVYAVRISRDGETRFKLITSFIFYRVLNLISDVKLPQDTGDFRLLDRTIVDALKLMPEKYRYLRGMIAWVGYKQTPLYYRRSPRFAGESKYPLKKMLKLSSDGIFSFSTIPLKIAVYIGLILGFLSILGIIYSVYTRLFTANWIPGWTLMFTAILLIAAVQFLILGIVGSYIGRIYNEVKKRPLYFIDEIM